jgi:hypothetical protein
MSPPPVRFRSTFRKEEEEGGFNAPRIYAFSAEDLRRVSYLHAMADVPADAEGGVGLSSVDASLWSEEEEGRFRVGGGLLFFYLRDVR